MSNIKTWEILKIEDISPSKFFPLFKHKIKMPNGKIISDYYVSELGNVSMIIPILSNGKIVLVRQYKHGIRRITIEFPAGRIEARQTPEQAAICELRQETGLSSSEFIFLGEVVPSATKDSTVVYGFIARNCSFGEKQEFDETEEIELIEKTESEIDLMILKGEMIVSDCIALWMKYKLT